jgi:hypothetical protein
MKIINKTSKWVEIDGESSFMVEYPTIEQQDEIDLLVAEIMYLDESVLGTLDKKEMDKKLQSFSAKNKARMIVLNKKLGRLALKYQVKNWKGVNNGTLKPVKIKLVPYADGGTQIEPKLFNQLVSSLSMWELIHIYNMISIQTGMSETDKKKL